MSRKNPRGKGPRRVARGAQGTNTKLEAALKAGHEKLQAGDFVRAEALLRKAIGVHGREPRLMANLVASLQRQGRLDDAERAAVASKAANPDHPATANNLGTILKYQGRLEESEAEFRRATELAPDHAEAWRNLMELKTFTDPEDPDLAAAEALLARLAPGNQARVGLYFALARALDEVGDVDRAFSCFERGNRLRRSLMNYQPKELARLVDDSIRFFDAAHAARPIPEGTSDERPVLVCGMPRSGSTLVEQILASHPEVEGVGEAPALPKALQHFIKDPRYRVQEAADLDDATLVALGQHYAGALRKLAPDAPVLVDKFLTNFLQVGVLRRALPGARFIHVRRAPMDNGFGIFRTLFTSTIPYAYDVGEIANAYAQTHRLCDHWAEVMPDSILQVDYEDLVRDLEGNARRILEFVGLPWDDACLAFHETERPVQTASATQVRQPIYSSSIERWRRYEAHLAPMARAFAEQGIQVDGGGA